MSRHAFALFAVLCAVSVSAGAQGSATQLGVFSEHGDVGVPSVIGRGSVRYDPATHSYSVTGGGANMWATADHFHYVWIKLSGDAALEAAVRFTGTSPSEGKSDPHRKACLVIRQSLDSDSPYADAATHGDGLTSLQWREAKGAITHEVQTNVVRPTRLRVEKRGDYVSMSIANGDEPLHPAGGAAKLHLTGDFYVGIAVSAHDTTRLETAEFSDVKVERLSPVRGRTTLINSLETISMRSKDRRVAYVVKQPERIEAPTFYPDSTRMLYFTTKGKLYRVQADLPGRPLDPARLAQPQEVPFAARPHVRQDGDSTYFSSARSGSAQIWRRSADGSQEQLTRDSLENVHPLLSPDGKSLLFLSYARGGGARSALRDASLRVMNLATHAVDEIAKLTGGDGSLGPAAWSPDSQYLTFVSYQAVPAR